MKFFCVGVMYSGEYDACDVTLSVYHTAGKAVVRSDDTIRGILIVHFCSFSISLNSSLQVRPGC